MGPPFDAPDRVSMEGASLGVALQAVDPSVDHVRGPEDAPLIVEYGDYECPHSRQAFRQIGRVHRGPFDVGTLAEAVAG
jgi:hypothetical protein